MPTTRNPLTRAFLFVEELRKLDQELPVQHAAALLLIAREEGITQQKVAATLGMGKSSAERAFAKLSDKGWPVGKPGYELIEVRPGQVDARERCAFLTAKGRRFVNSLVHLVEG
ncbi:MAG TPA: MarR family winged helix-turn-helix transcriptional regulator [Roseomonas sp.]|nr:MarR family winged helix-turn-helix transcriptional regulator [Roseomonas sp.]